MTIIKFNTWLIPYTDVEGHDKREGVGRSE